MKDSVSLSLAESRMEEEKIVSNYSYANKVDSVVNRYRIDMVTINEIYSMIMECKPMRFRL